jgi:hypothetical protein
VVYINFMTTIKEKCQKCGTFRESVLLRRVPGGGLVCRKCPPPEPRSKKPGKPFSNVRERLTQAGVRRHKSWISDVQRDLGEFTRVLSKTFHRPFSEVSFDLMLQVARQEDAEQRENDITGEELDALFSGT